MAESIPTDHIEVEFIVKNDGTYEAEVVGHGQNTKCSHGFDEQLLDEMTSGIGEANEFGHTQEYYDEKNGKIIISEPSKPSVSKGDNSKHKDKKLDLGYGV